MGRERRFGGEVRGVARVAGIVAEFAFDVLEGTGAEFALDVLKGIVAELALDVCGSGVGRFE